MPVVCLLREAEEKLGASEETHHKQLEAQQTSHDSHMTQLVQQKNREIEEANQRVMEKLENML